MRDFIVVASSADVYTSANLSGRSPSICCRRPFCRLKAPLGLSLLRSVAQTRTLLCKMLVGKSQTLELHRADAGCAISLLLLYRYGFTDGKEHPLIGTAIYFHLTKAAPKRRRNRPWITCGWNCRGGLSEEAEWNVNGKCMCCSIDLWYIMRTSLILKFHFSCGIW